MLFTEKDFFIDLLANIYDINYYASVTASKRISSGEEVD